jgi:hypothetical protein
MPKDDFRKARDKDIMKQALREYASGETPTFEHVSDEIPPLDKIRVDLPHPTKKYTLQAQPLDRSSVENPSVITRLISGLKSPNPIERKNAENALTRVDPRDKV